MARDVTLSEVVVRGEEYKVVKVFSNILKRTRCQLGSIFGYNDHSAGAFVLDYNDPTGVWDVVDAMHNYTMALRHVRPDDWTGELMLRTVHDCRMFAHPSFDTKQQRSILMDFFDQVLRFDAMRGRARKPPMDRTEMLDLAKKLLFRKGIVWPNILHCCGALLPGEDCSEDAQSSQGQPRQR